MAKKYVSPLQMMILSAGTDIGFNPSGETGIDDAPPNPFIPEEEGNILLPDGATVTTDESGDISITPESSDIIAADSDEAYY